MSFIIATVTVTQGDPAKLPRNRATAMVRNSAAEPATIVNARQRGSETAKMIRRPKISDVDAEMSGPRDSPKE